MSGDVTSHASGASSLGHVPRHDRWTFDESVATVFDDMLARSIPLYGTMRALVFDLGCAFVQPRTHIVDLGCSVGRGLAAFAERFGAGNDYVGVDAAEAMLDEARARFAADAAGCRVRIDQVDLRTDYPDADASLTLCVLTLQFLPVACRQQVIDAAYRNTVPGGALILVEKVVGSAPPLTSLMTERYYALKRANGYSAEEIERKRLALEGVLVPVTADANERLLRRAGFESVECVWRWLNFAGWLAVKTAAPADVSGADWS